MAVENQKMTQNEKLEEILKAIGRKIINEAPEIAKDIKDVTEITIYSSITRIEIPEVSIEKKYLVRDDEGITKVWVG